MTAKLRVTVVLSVGSVAVTVMVAVSPDWADVVSTCSTPLGFVDESVAALITTGVIGCGLLACRVRRRRPHWPGRSAFAGPETSWPKMV